MKHHLFRELLLLLLAALFVLPAQASREQPSAWAREGVAAAREAGLVPESLDARYDGPITRAEFCSLAAALYGVWDEAGAAEAKNADVSFTDCDQPEVLLCASLGVVNGVGDEKFNPDAPIRRQEAAAMLHRLAALQTGFADEPDDALPHVFDDGADLRSWARGDVYWAFHRGVMQGVGDNRFDPDGTYTREQSILTMLRLYDGAYAEPPAEEEPEELPWHVVVDNMGVGVSRVHLEDAEGNRMLTDFGDTGGTFYQIEMFGQWLSLVGVDQSMALYAPATKQLMVGYHLEQADPETGVGWAAAYYGPDVSRYRMVVYDDGTTGGRYCPAGDWQDGRAVVWSDANTLAAIDRAGTILWNFAAPGDWDAISCNGAGDRVILDQGGKRSLLADGKLTALPDGCYPILTDWSDSYILGVNGFYTLYDQNGKAMAGPYANALDEVGQDLYSRWVTSTRYEYFRCTESGGLQVLYTVDISTGRPGTLPTDGAGVYALRTNAHTIVCFDRFGDELGTIHLEFEMDPYASIQFEAGCVRVTCSDQYNGAVPPTTLYLPTGQQLS